MKKLKEAIPAPPPVKPAPTNKFEPAKVPVKTKPASLKRPSASEGSSLDNLIFAIKIRLGQLKTQPIIEMLNKSLRMFDSKVKRGVTDKELIQSYLSPLLGNIESLKGYIEGLEIELKKLDEMTQIEAVKETSLSLKSLVPENIENFNLSSPPKNVKQSGTVKKVTDKIDSIETGYVGRKKENSGKQHVITPYDEMWEQELHENSENMLNAIVASPADEVAEPYFSRTECYNCGDNMAGDRYDIVYKESLDGDMQEASVCPDCFQSLCG